MRGLRRLQNLTETLMGSIDAECDKAADELQKDHEAALDAVRSVKETVGGEIKGAVTGVKNMLNQITNTVAAGK